MSTKERLAELEAENAALRAQVETLLAPVLGSAGWPAWMARVANSMISLTSS